MIKKYNYVPLDKFDDIVSGEMTSLIVPNGITKISHSAFENSNLEYVEIPGSVLIIEEDAFYNCDKLETVVMHNGVKTLSNYSFGSSGVKEITIPESVTSIGSGVLVGCDSLSIIRYNAINASCTSSGLGLDDYPASGANVKVIIGPSVKKIPAYIFWTDDYYYSRLGEIEFEPGSTCTTIGSYAFRDCSYLKNITLPSSLTTIQSYAFYHCGITSIDIPNSVTAIPQYAFGYCGYLNSITIGSGVKSIGYAAFKGCPAPYITYRGTVSQWNNISKGEQWDLNLSATYVQCTNGQVSI